MTAADHLSGPLFHGSVHPLEGDTLLPGKRIGADYRDVHVRHGQSNKEVVSATSREATAWHMAQRQSSGRARVHVLEPHPETRVGVENEAHPAYQADQRRTTWTMSPIEDNHEYVAPSFKVKQTHDTKPGHQGTLPIDWRHHQVRPRSEYVEDANHPYPGHDISRAETAAHEEQSRRFGISRDGFQEWSRTQRRAKYGDIFRDRRPPEQVKGQEALF
jgi:hypothetical protein